MSKFIFGRNKLNFINTTVLSEYASENNLTAKDLHKILKKNWPKLTVKTVNSWLYKNRVPKAVLAYLNIGNVTKTKENSGLFVTLVPKNHEQVFKTFCQALGIDTKLVL